MSESGEMSEFGYIMELLAKGKVSDGTRGAAAWAPDSGTTWPATVGIRVHSSAWEGREAGIQGQRSQPGCPSSCGMQSSRLFFIAWHL